MVDEHQLRTLLRKDKQKYKYVCTIHKCERRQSLRVGVHRGVRISVLHTILSICFNAFAGNAGPETVATVVTAKKKIIMSVKTCDFVNNLSSRSHDIPE